MQIGSAILFRIPPNAARFDAGFFASARTENAGIPFSLIGYIEKHPPRPGQAFSGLEGSNAAFATPVRFHVAEGFCRSKK